MDIGVGHTPSGTDLIFVRLGIPLPLFLRFSTHRHYKNSGNTCREGQDSVHQSVSFNNGLLYDAASQRIVAKKNPR
jgi:hypothetical protein